MNKRQRKVFTLLRTKTKAIGLNRKELEGLALNIDKNLQLEEDASDEDVDAAIEDAIDAALPFLEVSQSVAQRSIQASLKRRNQQSAEDDDAEDDDADGEEGGATSAQGKGKKNQSNSEDSELMKFLKEQSEAIKTLKSQLDTLQTDRVKETRRTKLKKLVENTGAYGKSVLKQFGFMDFKDEDAFEDYLDEVRKDLEEMNQERANEGLKKLGEVPAGKKNKSLENDGVEAMSDDDIIALAGGKKEEK